MVRARLSTPHALSRPHALLRSERPLFKMTRHTSFVAVLALLLAAVAVVSGASTPMKGAQNDSAQKPEHEKSLFKRFSDRAAARRSALKKKAMSAVASSSSSSPVTAEFTSDRRGLASADSYTCLELQEVYDTKRRSSATPANRGWCRPTSCTSRTLVVSENKRTVLHSLSQYSGV